MAKLTRSASGERHLRWAREILASGVAHQQHNYLLTAAQQDALISESARIQACVTNLENAVGPYRDFVGHAHVDVRARQRVANFLCDEAQRQAEGSLRPYRSEIAKIIVGGYSAVLSKLPLSRVLRAGHVKTADLAESASSLLQTLPDKIPGVPPLAAGLDKAAALLRGFIKEADNLEKQRLPLRSAVQKAIFELREELEQMDGRLRSHFTQEFIDSLYPELNRKATAVVDEQDEDDDTSDTPEE